MSKFPVKVRRWVKQKQVFVSLPKQARQYVTTPTAQIVVVLLSQRKSRDLLKWFADKDGAWEVAMRHYSFRKCRHERQRTEEEVSKRESEEEGEMERVKQRHDRSSTKKKKS